MGNHPDRHDRHGEQIGDHAHRARACGNGRLRKGLSANPCNQRCKNKCNHLAAAPQRHTGAP